ncbi:MAG: hypothetical protein AAFY03_00070 [Pseudomonadota bacterium]
MISDILDEAATEIRYYMKHFPDAYRPIEQRLNALLVEMDAIMGLPGMDRPPLNPTP